MVFGRRRSPDGTLPNHTHDTSTGSDQSGIQYEHDPKVTQVMNPNAPTKQPSVRPFNHGKKATRGIKAVGESGRRGFHPLFFLSICFRSSCTLSKYVNILWPFVPAAIGLYAARHNDVSPTIHLWIFILSYVAIVPAANLVGFAGQELSRKLPQVFGVILETTLGSVVEIVLFMILIVTQGNAAVPIIKAAILGSILANMLLCLGVCFFVGGIRRQEQTFHEGVSEVGSNLMLVAGMGLIVPAAFGATLSADLFSGGVEELEHVVTNVSRATAIILFVAYLVYVFFQMRSHHGMYEDLLLQDEEKDADRHRDLNKAKLTLTEAVVALLFSLGIVSAMAYFLVEQIEPIIDQYSIKDAFLGLILVPVVEKAAEHITAADEAWDDQMNFALAHILGSSVQTALFNTPLVIFVAWGQGIPMNLDFETFDAVVLILAVLVVGGFLRDGKSNYLEGFLCVVVYIIIAIGAFYYPNPRRGDDLLPADQSQDSIIFGQASGTDSAATAVETSMLAAAELAKQFLKSIGQL